MIKKLKADLFFVVIVHSFLLVIEYFLLNNSSDATWASVAGISSVLNMIIEIRYMTKRHYLLSIGGIFIIFSYLFQCSFSILMMLNVIRSTDRFYTLFIPQHGMESFRKGTNVAIIFIGMCFIGYAIGRERYDRKQIIRIYNIEMPAVKSLGWIMTIVFGAIYFYSVLRVAIVVGLSSSYYVLTQFRNTMGYTTASSLHIYFFIGLYLLMIYYNNSGRKNTVSALLCISLISTFLVMMTGARSRGVVYIVLILIMWIKLGKKIKLKQVILFGIGGLILLQLLYAIRITRQYSFSISNVITAFFSSSNIVYETMSEFGWSVFVTGLLDEASAIWHPFDFIIKELGSIIPRSGSFGGNVMLAPTVLTGVEARVHGGTTYIADFFYYYKWIGIIVLFVLGIWIAFWDSRFQHYSKHGDIIHVAIIVGWANGILNSIRSPATFNIKLLLYSYIIVLILSAFVMKGKITSCAVNTTLNLKGGDDG